MILHFCRRVDWDRAVPVGEYRGDTLATEGFIHFSPPELVVRPANAFAAGRTDLVLLEVDVDRLPVAPVYEPGDPQDPDSPLFPHLYGPLPVAAVVAVHDFPPGPDGRFTLPASLSAR